MARSTSTSNTVGRRNLVAPAAKRRPAAKRATAGPPKLSKDELQARIAKLERANTTLRIKNKDLRQATEDMAERLDRLEAETEALRRKAASAARAAPKATPAPRRAATPTPAPTATATAREDAAASAAPDRAGDLSPE